MDSIANLMNLSGRRALITGASGQLGRIFADTLAELGADLLIVDLENDQLETVSAELHTKWGVRINTFCVDLENQNQRMELIEKIKSFGENVNIVVNNAAYVGSSNLSGWSVPFENQTIESWRKAMEVNLIAVFELCQGLYPTLATSPGANIINISSIYGSYGPDWRLYEGTQMGNPAAYAASKGGLIQLTRWLATTMAPNVRVNAISPGGVENGQNSSFIEKYESRTPLERMATPQDLKGAMAFLASDLSEYVTGHILEVNGGWGTW